MTPLPRRDAATRRPCSRRGPVLDTTPWHGRAGECDDDHCIAMQALGRRCMDPGDGCVPDVHASPMAMLERLQAEVDRRWCRRDMPPWLDQHTGGRDSFAEEHERVSGGGECRRRRPRLGRPARGRGRHRPPRRGGYRPADRQFFGGSDQTEAIHRRIVDSVRQPPRAAPPQSPPCTQAPPTAVATTSMSPISSAGTSRGLAPRTTKSASCPERIWPLRPPQPVAVADPTV